MRCYYVLLLVVVALCDAQDQPITAVEAVKMMGVGINFGGSWDGNIAASKATIRAPPVDFPTMKNIINKMKSHGFRHVRIPVSWTFGNNPQPISSFGGTLDELKQTVAYALSQDLFVVLNWHGNHPNSSTLLGFQAGWHTLSSSNNYFSPTNFPTRKLIFEVLNEPNYNNNNGGGEGFTRQVNLVGYSEIRKSDSTRIVLVMPDNNGNWLDLNSVYPSNKLSLLPGGGKDLYLGVNVHSYDPWNFAGEGDESGYPGCDFYVKMSQSLYQWFNETGVAMTLNEFGLGAQPRDSGNDHCYLSLMSNLQRQHNIAPAVWNDYQSFGIIGTDGEFLNGDGPAVVSGCSGNCGCGC